MRIPPVRHSPVALDQPRKKGIEDGPCVKLVISGDVKMKRRIV